MPDWQIIQRLIDAAQYPLADTELERRNGNHEPYYRFLYLAATIFQPKIALEIGVDTGLASLHMAAAMEVYDGQVIGIDILAQDLPAKELNSMYGNYWFFHGDSCDPRVREQVVALVDRYGLIGLVYQDSSHHYEASCTEWGLYSPLCKQRALWVCDDITPAFHDPRIDPPGKGMVQFFSDLPGDKRLFPDVMHRGNTQGIILL